MDHIVGILHEKDFNQTVLDGKTSIEEIIKPPVTVSKGIKDFQVVALVRISEVGYGVGCG